MSISTKKINLNDEECNLFGRHLEFSNYDCVGNIIMRGIIIDRGLHKAGLPDDSADLCKLDDDSYYYYNGYLAITISSTELTMTIEYFSDSARADNDNSSLVKKKLTLEILEECKENYSPHQWHILTAGLN